MDAWSRDTGHACGTRTEELRTTVLDGLAAGRVADLFKMLADPTRVRIIGLLVDSELCVSDLCAILDMSQPTISHQLRSLRQLRLVTARKEGRHVLYTLVDAHVRDLFQRGLAHVQHD